MDFLTPEVREVALSLMAELDCSLSLGVAILIRHEEWEQLVEISCSPERYIDADSYARNNQAACFLKKYNVGLPGRDLEAEAIKKWSWSEAMCYRTNRKFNEYLDFGTYNGAPAPGWIDAFVRRLQKNTQWLIGSSPPRHIDGNVGPGATMSDGGLRTTVLHKFASVPTLTPSASSYVAMWSATKWARAVSKRGGSLKIVKGNSFFTVSKKATERRGCAKEPSLNSFYQGGLGRCMRRRLKNRGIDLENGQDIHRQVACSASKSGEFCTIDLTSASDLGAIALVRLCTSPLWFKSLSDLRSPFTKVDGKWHRLEKFSSMGNGYTFELETAIFTAICMSAVPGLTPGVNLWVYGDDIIAPSASSDCILAALEFCGFVPNRNKTFTKGVFRESCGGDFFDGVPVRAFYLKEVPSEPQHFMALANGLRSMSVQTSDSTDQRPLRFRRAWFSAMDFIPKHIRRCRGPQGLGDLVLHDDESRWITRWRSQIRYICVYRPARFSGPRLDRFDADVLLAGCLYGLVPHGHLRPGLDERCDNRILVERGGVSGYKLGWVAYS